jgi:hypothetical protein
MRFGMSATSLMCPKNLRTRLRPVNVCCAIVASHVGVLQGDASSKRDCRRTRVEFRSISKAGSCFQGRQSPEFVLQTFKTQNAVRGAPAHPPVRSIFHGLQKPEIA